MSPVPSSRDEEETRRQLQAWLAPRLGTDVVVSDLNVPGGSGFSNETLLFSAAWTAGGEARTADLAARVRPIGYAVFPEYDLSLQYRCLEAVAARSTVPVPHVRWFEPDEAALGAPFFVMDQVVGQVPPDSPTYTAGGWLFDASPADQARLHRGALGVLAELHRLDWEDGFRFLQHHDLGPPGMATQLVAGRAFLEWAAEGGELPVHEAALRWLEANRPDEPPTGVNWGDARIGNMMFRDFEPVAVFDWEMATLGPGEVDLAWWLLLERYSAEGNGQPPLPGFPAREETIASYEELLGRPVRDLEYYEVWAALRFAIVLVRVIRMMTAHGVIPPGSGFDLDNFATAELRRLIGPGLGA
ncbi:MAG TPA: phosphotransferase family protein [Acidimicrobiales bacterium]|nr:phosphotransferase family protein [Acidimicrobiales bacterium]